MYECIYIYLESRKSALFRASNGWQLFLLDTDSAAMFVSNGKNKSETF